MVSILARLWGRALLKQKPFLFGRKRFQSSPGFGAGRYVWPRYTTHYSYKFQSSPGFGAGRYEQIASSNQYDTVFQSSPGFGAGRYPDNAVVIGVREWFQSSPGFGAGRYAASDDGLTTAASFNPRPALGPGATIMLDYPLKQMDVSILARLWGRALPLRSASIRWMTMVSILARLWGRALHINVLKQHGIGVFQSSPGFGAGRYLQGHNLFGSDDLFQSSPGFGAGRYSTTATRSYNKEIFCSRANWRFGK